MIALYHDAAEKSKARLVHQAAFDSVPGDISTFLLSKKLQEKGETLVSARFFQKSKGTFSGGTLRTALTHLLEKPELVYPKMSYDPLYHKNQESSSKPKVSGGSQLLKFHPEPKQYAQFFALAPGNMCSVRRTSAFREYHLDYNETTLVGGLF